ALALGPDGRVANVKGSALGSADSAGWLFARVDELQNETRMDPKALRNPSTLAAEGLLGSLSTDGFLENKSLETWMDTSYEDDGRFGKRIEIQALSLRLLRAASRFTKNGKYELREKSYLERVKKSFFNGKSLADGLNDPTIRPNLFIAAYLYPDLLSPKEWEACFDFALPKLWLSWGGLSTINTKHPLFQKEHTGEDNRSYHRGDSWYYLNCMAAISLLRVNPKKYRKYADKILCASVQEILWQGAIGHHAELSSASSLKSQGCLSQAWSSAMFAELVLEISGK
ncbi:MAG TPA: amylo-alpha-1,6-glucosidase, partial [Candidatus Nanoarchaeia archaeon]|nr:amylo-alpha-1,6-glucosidase [Candidatus Nanoarchaeia archaeon]